MPGIGINLLCLSGQIVGKRGLRYTPAGIAVLDFDLEHVSLQWEAGIERCVEMQMAARAAGELALQIDQAPMLPQSGAYRFIGFVARKGRNGRQTVFHINAFE